MIRRSLINAKVLPQKGRTNGVTSWLTIVEVLLRDTISEIVLRNCVHVIGSDTNVKDVFGKDAAQLVVESVNGEDEGDKMSEGPFFISRKLVVCNAFLVSLLY